MTRCGSAASTRWTWPGTGPSRRCPRCCGPGRWPPAGAAGPWRATPEAVQAAGAAQAALPPGTLPLERLQVIVPALAAADPLRLHLDPPAVIAAGQAIIGGMVDCLPARGPGSRAR